MGKTYTSEKQKVAKQKVRVKRSIKKQALRSTGRMDDYYSQASSFSYDELDYLLAQSQPTPNWSY